MHLQGDGERPVRLISFSLWGGNRFYTQGAIENARLAPKIYPGWTVRYYCAPDVPLSIRSDLLSYGAQIIERDAVRGSYEGLFWRFEPAADPTIERFISRDTDSRLNEREAAAVDEWIVSGDPFHVMRDHAEHEVAMPGGMWGARGGSLPQLPAALASWHSFSEKGCDQEFLSRLVWPFVRDRTLVHDSMMAIGPEHRSYNPSCFGGAPARPFPRHAPMSQGSFVGERIDSPTATKDAP